VGQLGFRKAAHSRQSGWTLRHADRDLPDQVVWLQIGDKRWMTASFTIREEECYRR